MKPKARNHPKVKHLMRALEIPKPYAVGLLESIWLFTFDNTPQGDIGKYSNSDIADDIGWPGDPDKLIEAFISTGWLDPCEKRRLIVHDWPSHCGELNKKNLKYKNLPFYEPVNSEKFGNFRKNSEKFGLPSLPSPSLPYPSPPPPDEYSGVPSYSCRQDVSNRSDSQQHEQGSMQFPCRVSNQCPEGVWTLTPEKLAEYRESYPKIPDLEGELRSARQWLRDHPGRLKTSRGMGAFLGNWLRRPAPNGRHKPPPEEEEEFT